MVHVVSSAQLLLCSQQRGQHGRAAGGVDCKPAPRQTMIAYPTDEGFILSWCIRFPVYTGTLFFDAFQIYTRTWLGIENRCPSLVYTWSRVFVGFPVYTNVFGDFLVPLLCALGGRRRGAGSPCSHFRPQRPSRGHVRRRHVPLDCRRRG